MDFDKLKATIQASVGYDSQGHWCTVKPLNTEGLHGFVYVIHNQKDDRYYIGKKNFLHGGKKSYKRGGKRIPNYKHGTETDWKEYCGSSRDLQRDLEKHGEENFSFTILYTYETRGGLSYGEANLQHKLDVLVERHIDGTPRYYNQNIAAIKYIPREMGTAA